jgi:hypothetical protein
MAAVSADDAVTASRILSLVKRSGWSATVRLVAH